MRQVPPPAMGKVGVRFTAHRAVSDVIPLPSLMTIVSEDADSSTPFLSCSATRYAKSPTSHGFAGLAPLAALPFLASERKVVLLTCGHIASRLHGVLGCFGSCSTTLFKIGLYDVRICFKSHRKEVRQGSMFHFHDSIQTVFNIRVVKVGGVSGQTIYGSIVCKTELFSIYKVPPSIQGFGPRVQQGALRLSFWCTRPKGTKTFLKKIGGGLRARAGSRGQLTSRYHLFGNLAGSTFNRAVRNVTRQTSAQRGTDAYVFGFKHFTHGGTLNSSRVGDFFCTLWVPNTMVCCYCRVVLLPRRGV